jgi:hypothetical protein
MEYYAKRKKWQLKTLSNELQMISNQARFYQLVTEGKLTGTVPGLFFVPSCPKVLPPSAAQ